ncbi:MAG: HD-GYP domain-containing protein [Ferrimonas sp.]
MIQAVPLAQVTVGMYVVDNPANAKLNQQYQGLISDDGRLQRLQHQAHCPVFVDFSRSTASVPLQDTEQVTIHSLHEHTVAVYQHIMANLRYGECIDIFAVKKSAETFIAELFRNQKNVNHLHLITEKAEDLLEHSLGTTILMAMFARHLGYDEDTIQQLCYGTLLHDIGKIRLSDEILNKPARLTDEEMQAVKTHTLHSRDILFELGLSPLSISVAVQHHEKLDGSGYPLGLKGDEISQFTRMISICDIFDALRANRVYRPRMPISQAIEIIRSYTPHQLDAKLVDEFILCLGLNALEDDASVN